jgi:hypothetical protein
VLLNIEQFLRRYENPSSKDESTFPTLDENYGGTIALLRDGLRAHVFPLSYFYSTFSSVFKLEDGIIEMLQEMQTGQRSAHSVLIVISSSADSLARTQA